ncbi:MAG: response regulator transcription factor [Phycisphaerae bacterium]|nr:response regulator transcription factor [Gemmatimonadaceae bacterium]
MTARILIVEDQLDVARSLKANLELEGHVVAMVGTGEDGVNACQTWTPDLVILDLMLPVMSGFDVLRTIRRRQNDVPVLILSARTTEIEKVEGFRLGADDYVTKPFGLMEVLARIDALLRRRMRTATSESGAAGETLTFGQIVIDPAARTVHKSEVEVVLRPREFDLLVALVRHRGRVVTRGRLLEEVWGYDASVVSRTVDTHMLELRRRLEDDPAHPRHLITLRGAGYRLVR